MISIILDFIFGSQIVSQFWNKILAVHDMDWTILKSHVKHRFGSMVFPIDDMLKYFFLIYEFVMEYEKEHGIVDAFKCKWLWYSQQLKTFKQQQTSRPQKHSATQPAEEVARLLCTKEPQPPQKPPFVQMYEYVKNESTPFLKAIVGDYIDLMRLMGQQMAHKNKIYCTEVLFVEDAECKLDCYSMQNLQNPHSPRFKLKVAQMKIISVQMIYFY